MDQRSKTIVVVGVAAILISLGIFVVLYSGYEHRISFVTDPDDLAKYFVVVDDDTGETNPLAKGSMVFDRTTITSNTDDIIWNSDPATFDNSTVICHCTLGGTDYRFVMWIHGADLLGAELKDGKLCVHVTDTIFNFALALSLGELS